ncbi:PI-PLC X domain-containing protein 3 [Arctopsyche grandis]|uniref:PI-PLC X domain-containing protein 3 n=1 Tax=Arctopsyche grandis TaxID=121162 RepID=UPI00406D9412
MTDGLQIDLENWMSQLPESIKNTPFIYLAIPGSHDSMTFNINRDSTLAPDAPSIVRRLWPLFKGTIIRWSKTQQINVHQQLFSGIRFFDLRFATKSDTNKIFFTHGLYAGEVEDGFNEIKSFLDSHPDEVIILDCQHFYEFKLEDHRRLFSILVNTFGLRICPPQHNLEAITLNSLSRQRQQIIIVYRNEVVVSSGRFWRNGQMPTPWPRQTNTKGLLDWMASAHRSPSAGFVLQAVLTPTTAFVILKWRSNIRDSCAKPVVNKVLPWIDDLLPGPPPLAPFSSGALRVNVVIADFVDFNQNIFPKSIIALNYKLLSSDQ